MLAATPTTVRMILLRNAPRMRVPSISDLNASVFHPIGKKVTLPDSISCTSLSDSAIVLSNGNKHVMPSRINIM
ncbi:hypothetical protein D3C75_966890 [compost metagenome]